MIVTIVAATMKTLQQQPRGWRHPCERCIMAARPETSRSSLIYNFGEFIFRCCRCRKMYLTLTEDFGGKNTQRYAKIYDKLRCVKFILKKILCTNYTMNICDTKSKPGERWKRLKCFEQMHNLSNIFQYCQKWTLQLAMSRMNVEIILCTSATSKFQLINVAFRGRNL